MADIHQRKHELQSDQISRINCLSGTYSSLEPVFIGWEDESMEFLEDCVEYGRSLGLNPVKKLFSRESPSVEIMNYISQMNEDDGVFGLVVMLEANASGISFVDSVTPSKELAGLSTQNVRLTNQEGFEPYLSASTLLALDCIGRRGIHVAGKEVLLLYSQDNKNVLEPLSNVLKNNKAIVTMSLMQKDTQIGDNIKELCNRADILISNSNLSSSFANFKDGALVLDFSSDSGLQALTVPYLYQNIVRGLEETVQNLLNAKWNLSLLPLKTLEVVPSDSQISLAQTPKKVSLLSREIGLGPSDIRLYGESMAKIELSVLEKFSRRREGKYVLVAGINPTPFGEGKSTTTIGLCQALGSQSKKNVFACVRQPSQGPTFGIKGGAAGGGYSQVIPMQEFNLHLTGDIHAVTAANNLLAAQIDARVFHEEDQRLRGRSAGIKGMFSRLVPGKVKKFSAIQLQRLQKLGIHTTVPSELTEDEKERFSFLNIDPATITINRVIDTNDRMLRKITIAQSPTEKGRTRETRFDISVASEIMAVLSLAEDLGDMKSKLEKIVVAFDKDGEPVTAQDLGVVEALCALVKDALKPTLMQTLEGTPVLVHTGPFANIAHGNSSILADKIALKLVGEDGYVVTEAGFGADIGMEKFFNIKCRLSKLNPNAVVIVCTVRALKMHGDPEPKTGDALTRDTYSTEDEALLKKGFENVGTHIENAKKFGVPVVVCVNQFKFDTEKELILLRDLCKSHGAFDCVISNHWAKGGLGARDLASAVVNACESKGFNFKFLYPLERSIIDKINTIAKEIYRAGNVEFSKEAQEQIKRLESQGFGTLPICMAKTQFSFSSDPNMKGAPKGFSFPVKSVVPSIGAGFLVVFAGAISTMPGLPVRPCFYDMEFDTKTEKVAGLF